MRPLFDHVDWRVRSLAEVKTFYVKFLPAGFPEIDENADYLERRAFRANASTESELIQPPKHRSSEGTWTGEAGRLFYPRLGVATVSC